MVRVIVEAGENEPSERQRLQAKVAAAGGSRNRLKAMFDELTDRLGLEAASWLWWAVFGAQDAAET